MQKNHFETLHVFRNGKDKNLITYIILVQKFAKELVVAFSGTQNTFQLIEQIMSADLKSYSLHPEVSNAMVVNYYDKYYREYFRKDFENNLKKYMEEYPNYKIIFTGHSLGGAMSMQAATDAVLSKWIDPKKTAIYTFGQPRVGNYIFAQILEKRYIISI